jgi:protein-L-isoaspartate(D-aspartate) O-methyltransferase
MNKTKEFEQLREKMVQEQLKARDITDERVLDAMASVPREMFMPEDKWDLAYADHPVPIGHGQTISQPYIVALMSQLLDLDGSEVVLDVGTGCGYQAAVLGKLAKKIVSVEIIEDLAESAKDNLSNCGYDNVQVVVGDGRKGYAEQAPYDGIKSAAATREVPQAWKDQLASGGKIVLPLSSGRWGQELVRLTKAGEDFEKESFGAVAFVPLVSK